MDRDLKSDLSEIIMWQQMNKQLIHLKENDSSIHDSHHRFLRDFCFEHHVFQSIRSSIVDDIPLAFVTDFSNTSFMTLSLENWLKCLLKLVPNSYSLDVDQALTDVSNVSNTYYKPHQQDIYNEKEDVELYKFIGKYLELREEEKCEFHEIMIRYYNIKSNFIDVLIGLMDDHYEVENMSGSYKELVIVPDQYYDINAIHSIYMGFLDLYRKLLLNTINGYTNVSDFLNEIIAGKELSQPISDFVLHELRMVKDETEALLEVERHISISITNRNFGHYVIPICYTDLIGFLLQPFPVP